MNGQPTIGDALRRRVQFVTGKGGVGKTTIVAALGMAAAARGQRPVVLELGTRSVIGPWLNRGDIGFEPSEVVSGLAVARMELEPALIDYVTRFLRVKALVRPMIRSKTFQRFVTVAPGVLELATLYRIGRLAEDGWDPILVDLEASGHAMMFFELPHVFRDIARVGPVHDLLSGIGAIAREPASAAVHLVSRPEPLVVSETVELYAGLQRTGVSLGDLFINRVRAPFFSADERAALDEAAELTHAELALARRQLCKDDEHVGCLSALRAQIPLPTLQCPAMAGDAAEVIGALTTSLQEDA